MGWDFSCHDDDLSSWTTPDSDTLSKTKQKVSDDVFYCSKLLYLEHPFLEDYDDSDDHDHDRKR